MWRRGAKRQSTQVPTATAVAEQRRHEAPAVTLRPMTDAEYVGMRAFMDEDYARDIAHVMDLSLDEARAAAAKQLAELLKDGLATEGHFLWKVATDEDGAVGDLWAFVAPAKRRAFVYFIGIDARHRGKGFGRAAMLALEAAVKPLGADHIDLNVFGDNTTAIRLYETLGYRPTAITMRKQL